MATALSYEEKMLRKKAQHYLLCMSDKCSRKEHCHRWHVAQWTPDDMRIANVINPYRKDVVEGNCIDFRSDKKRRMARGMVNFYENIPEPKAKAIRKAIIADLTKTKYFKSATTPSPSPRKIKPTSPLSAVPMAGNEPLSFDSYYEEYDF